MSVAPNDAARAFCGELAASLEKCDRALDRAHCLSLAKVYTDQTLDEARKCTSKSCSVIMDCVDATL